MSHLVTAFVGRFQMWSYSPSHGRLLLRSTKSADRNTQVDVLFKNVAVISIPVVFDNLEIHRAPLESLTPLPSFGVLSAVGRDFFQIVGRDVEGYVIAGLVLWDESDGEFDAPSTLLV